MINYEIKSQLAKLLATEDIIVENTANRTENISKFEQKKMAQ